MKFLPSHRGCMIDRKNIICVRKCQKCDKRSKTPLFAKNHVPLPIKPKELHDSVCSEKLRFSLAHSV